MFTDQISHNRKPLRQSYVCSCNIAKIAGQMLVAVFVGGEDRVGIPPVPYIHGRGNSPAARQHQVRLNAQSSRPQEVALVPRWKPKFGPNCHTQLLPLDQSTLADSTTSPIPLAEPARNSLKDAVALFVVLYSVPLEVIPIDTLSKGRATDTSTRLAR